MSPDPQIGRAQPIIPSFRREDSEPFKLESRVDFARRGWDKVRSSSLQRGSLTNFSLEGDYTDVKTGTYVDATYQDRAITKGEKWFMGRLICQTIEPIMGGQKYGLRFSYGPKYGEFISYFGAIYPHFEFSRLDVNPTISKKVKVAVPEKTPQIVREISEEEIRLIEERLRANGSFL